MIAACSVGFSPRPSTSTSQGNPVREFFRPFYAPKMCIVKNNKLWDGTILKTRVKFKFVGCILSLRRLVFFLDGEADLVCMKHVVDLLIQRF